MIVAEKLRGMDPVILTPRSRTMLYQPTAEWINQQRAQMLTPNLSITRLRGLGDGMSTPSWLPWAAAGLVGGLAVGYGVYKYRKGKRR